MIKYIVIQLRSNPLSNEGVLSRNKHLLFNVNKVDNDNILISREENENYLYSCIYKFVLNQNLYPIYIHNINHLILIMKDTIGKNYNDVKITYKKNSTYI